MRKKIVRAFKNWMNKNSKQNDSFEDYFQSFFDDTLKELYFNYKNVQLLYIERSKENLQAFIILEILFKLF